MVEELVDGTNRLPTADRTAGQASVRGELDH